MGALPRAILKGGLNRTRIDSPELSVHGTAVRIQFYLLFSSRIYLDFGQIREKVPRTGARVDKPLTAVPETVKFYVERCTPSPAPAPPPTA